VSPPVAARLASLNIHIVAEAAKHFVFARENCVALVERTESGFGSIGSTGIMTEAGLAYLVWRDRLPLLAGKAGERSADTAQVEAIRRFSEDLKSALA
jgi:hypothetical protein